MKESVTYQAIIEEGAWPWASPKPRLSTALQNWGSEFVGQVANLPGERQVGNLPHELRPPFLN